MSEIMDIFVRSVSPKGKSTSSVRIWIIIIFCIPMILLTNPSKTLQLRVSALLLANIFVRLIYPSCYYPASAISSGFAASPVTARAIAFVGEFAMYELWAVWIGKEFWGSQNYLWVLVLIGECISTIGVLLQSEILLNIEDTIWAIHSTFMCYLSLTPHAQFGAISFFGFFALHLFFVHLPKRFQMMSRRKWGLFHSKPLFLTSTGFDGNVSLRECSFEEKSWVVPMLLGQPILTALMYYQLND